MQQRALRAELPADARPARATKRRAPEIVEAAAKVFARRGYHGASTQDIADVLGIRQASLYYYFASKEAALEAVCARGVADYAERAEAILASEGSAADKVARLLAAHLAPLRERGDFTRTFLRERRFLPDPARHRIRRLERRYERAIAGVVRQGIERGEFLANLNARMATLALLGLANSAAGWYGREPGVTLERVAAQFAELLVRGFRVPESVRGGDNHG